MKICKLKSCKNSVKSTDARTKFCSRTCASIYRNTGVRRHGTGKLKSHCEFCKKAFLYNENSQSGIYCSTRCNGLHRSQLHKESWKANNPVILQSITRDSIRKYLIDDFGNKCSNSVCSVSDTWNNELIVLVVDHIDGNPSNNSYSNMRLLCPNCNSQTNTFGGRNKGSGRKSRGLKLH